MTYICFILSLKQINKHIEIMKLELKHLAPYLPYGLKYATLSDDDDNYYINSKHNTVGVGGNQSNITNICLVEYSKPLYKIILRPLSDLTKEIVHNGEKFVPLQYLQINIDWYNLEQWKSDHKLMNVEEYNNLLSWHFDVFGLIEQGLALSYNDL